MSPIRSCTVFALAFSGAAWLATNTGAQIDFRLNAPLERSRREGFSVGAVRVVPGGERIVYDAALESEDRGLFTARVDGSEPARRLVPAGTYHSLFDVSSEWVVFGDDVDLYRVPVDASRPSAPILPAAQRRIHALEISPGGNRVVYVASLDGGPRQLFSAAIRGDPAPIRISGAPSTESIFGFRIAPNGKRVVFEQVGKLLSTPIDGSAPPVQLVELMLGSNLSRLEIGSDSARVVYAADQDQRGVTELYSVPLDGSAPARKLNGPLVFRGDVWSFALAPDARRVVYLADQEADERRELYSVPIDASSSAVKLNGPLVRGGSVMYSEFQISPTSSRVAYWAQEQSQAVDLFVAPIDGRSKAFPLSGGQFGATTFSPDSRRIVYRSGSYGDVSLLSAQIGLEQAIDLTAPIGPLASIFDTFVTKDGASVVFLEGPGNAQRIQRVPLLGGSAPVLLSDVPISSRPELVSDGGRILFRACPTVDWLDEIYSVPVDGTSGPVRLNDAPVVDLVTADVTDACVNPAGGRAAFVVRVPAGFDGGDDRLALYSTALGPRSSLQLFPAAGEFRGDIEALTIDATGEYVVFLAERGYVERELWSARLDGQVPPIRLDEPFDSPSTFRITPDGARVLFDADEPPLRVGTALHAVPIGGGPVTRLADEPADGGLIVSLEVTGDGARAVFVSGRSSRSFQLFSVPVDGSASPVRLNGDLAPGGNVDLAFALGPDSSTPGSSLVVYRADQARNDVFELFAVPADGASAPVKLSGTLVPNGDVEPGFRFSPDGRTVVFRADRAQDHVLELFAAPIAGSVEPVRLNGTPVPGGNVEPDFAILPDSTRVVFRGDLLQDERFELFDVLLDGSADPVRLSGGLVAGGDVVSARVSLDGTRVVYRADATVDGRFELYSRLLRRNTVPIPVSGPLVAGGDVLEGYELVGGAGDEVVYVADAGTNDVFELYAAPLERRNAARKLNGPLVPGGDAAVIEAANTPVASFALTPDGRAVLYRADQGTDDVVELYLSFLEGDSPPESPR